MIMENPLPTDLPPEEVQAHIIQIRRPKKVLHFSDGVLEEYSDDEVDETSKPVVMTVVDTKSLNWGSWLYHYAWMSGFKALEYCDYVGEGLASFLGITTPKYQLEISEHERLESAKRKLQEESAGWVTDQERETPLVMQPVAMDNSGNMPIPI